MHLHLPPIRPLHRPERSGTLARPRFEPFILCRKTHILERPSGWATPPLCCFAWAAPIMCCLNGTLRLDCMRSLSRVVWFEGMYLGPHHFQAQSRYFEDSTNFATS